MVTILHVIFTDGYTEITKLSPSRSPRFGSQCGGEGKSTVRERGLWLRKRWISRSSSFQVGSKASWNHIRIFSWWSYLGFTWMGANVWWVLEMVWSCRAFPPNSPKKRVRQATVCSYRFAWWRRAGAGQDTPDGLVLPSDYPKFWATQSQHYSAPRFQLSMFSWPSKSKSTYSMLGFFWPHEPKYSTRPCVLRHSFTTRLLYSLIPATWYAKEFSTMDGFSEGIAADFEAMFEQGIVIEAPWRSL